MSPIAPVTVSPELLLALEAAGLLRLCDQCRKSGGLCEPCLAIEGPRFARTSLWLRLMGKREGDGCPKCGSELRVEAPTDGSMWLHCTSRTGCNYWMRVETAEERAAREAYEAKAERRAQALARATAAVNGRFVKNRPKRTDTRIPVRRVA